MVQQPVSMGGIGRPRPGTTCRHRTKPVIIPLENDIIVVYEKAAAAAKAAAIRIKKEVQKGMVKWHKEMKEKAKLRNFKRNMRSVVKQMER